MTDLIYPTIDLFLYDLRYSLGDSPEEVDKNRQNFRNKFPETIRLLLQDNEDIDGEYVHLIANESAISAPLEDLEVGYEGYYYPVLLGDSYGLQIECALNKETKIEPDQYFLKIKEKILEKLNGTEATIGQTWMLSGWRSPSESENQEEIAKACYKSFMPNRDWEGDLEGQGRFLGATIFELTQSEQHTIIVIYPDEGTLINSGKFYADWMRLFYYRNKIVWAYTQSRIIKKSIQTYFSIIKSGSDSVEQRRSKRSELEALRQTLVEVQNMLNDYTKELTLLDFQGGTIDINKMNYEKRLGTIKQKAKKIAPSAETELKFLNEFSKLAKDKYQLQITKDSENLERGFKFLSDTINAVRSRVEVAKAESDRNFQDAITILGVGWSVGSFVGSRPNLGKDPKDPVRLFLSNPPLVPKSLLEPAIPLTYTLSAALVAAALAWLLIRLWPGLSSVIPKLASVIPKSKKE
jgi:hypothetical protein